MAKLLSIVNFLLIELTFLSRALCYHISGLDELILKFIWRAEFFFKLLFSVHGAIIGRGYCRGIVRLCSSFVVPLFWQWTPFVNQAR